MASTIILLRLCFYADLVADQGAKIVNEVCCLSAYGQRQVWQDQMFPIPGGNLTVGSFLLISRGTAQVLPPCFYAAGTTSWCLRKIASHLFLKVSDALRHGIISAGLKYAVLYCLILGDESDAELKERPGKTLTLLMALPLPSSCRFSDDCIQSRERGKTGLEYGWSSHPVRRAQRFCAMALI